MHPARYVDSHAAELLFRQNVIGLLAAKGLLDEGRLEHPRLELEPQALGVPWEEWQEVLEALVINRAA